MAIVLNTPNKRGISRDEVGISRPAVVPPAMVWEPAAPQSAPRQSLRHSPGVRTLSPIDRTQERSQEKLRSRASTLNSDSNRRWGSSNVGNYVLGAVFGVAVFVGTVWGGLSIDSEASFVPAPSPSAVASSH